MDLLTKLADLLDAAADDLDQARAAAPVPAVKMASADVMGLAQAYEDATGEVLSPELQTKLASDAQLAAAITKIAAHRTREPLGSADDDGAVSTEAPPPATRGDVVKRAYADFEKRILGNS
jgi:hypothetical protein